MSKPTRPYEYGASGNVRREDLDASRVRQFQEVPYPYKSEDRTRGAGSSVIVERDSGQPSGRKPIEKLTSTGMGCTGP